MIFKNIKIVHNSFNSLELVNQNNSSAAASRWTATGALWVFCYSRICFTSALNFIMPNIFSNLFVTEIQRGSMYSLASMS